MEQKNSKNNSNLKNGFEPKNFLFVSIDALIADIAWHVVKEGHNAKLFVENPEDAEVADGFVPKVDDWEKEVDWADVIIFDDVLGHGTKAKKLRDAGKLVVGGTPYTDMLEDDRAFGQEELKKHGVPILPYRDFTSFEEAIDFVKANPGQYVIKPSGEAQNIKGLLFIGEEDDGKDVIQVLSDYNKAWSKKIPLFQLQKRVNGVEIAVGAFFNGKEFIYPINVNFEHKKLFPGNLGPSTGEMGCYDEETEVLTEMGWKFFRELNYEDKICTLNPENDVIEFNAPEEIVVFDHHNELISIKNQTLDLMVTPDHNMYVSGQWNARNKKNSFNFVKAKDLEYQSVIKRTGKWIGTEEEYFIIPSVQLGHYEGRQVVLHETGEIKILMDDWLAFMGIYIAEGSASNNKVNISQSKKKEFYNKIKSLLEKLDFKFSETDSGFNIYDKQLSSYFSVFGKAPQKFVPEFVKSLRPRQISVFLEWFALGDGTQMKGYRIFYTSSKMLADGIQELLLKIGRVGIIKERKRNDKTWIVDHFADSSRIQFEVHERVKKLESWIDKKDIKKTEYKGKVYCATVKNHIMFVRRNGKPCWCGNTAMFWSVPNKIFNNTLKKFEGTLAKENFVGYIDINCMVNNYGIYPLEFTSRFGYPTISIQEHAMITPIGQFLFDLAKGENPKLKVHNGFQIGVRIVVPPFPFDDPETFEVKSKDSVIFFKKGTESVHIEDVKLVNGEWVVTGNSGVILIVCGSGQTMKQAQQQVYSKIKNIIIPHMYYRKDIGDRWFEDSDRLHNWGYLRET
ncbi:MAG: phosphoribosylglycinamide synthetase C domain-containing protein [Candidatus Micrarchaeota archaeon]